MNTMTHSRRVMLFYPPGRFYQRGEDRSQGNVENSTATTMRAPNDLGYAAATLKAKGFEVFLRDYQTSLRTLEELLADFDRFAPDAVFVSITNATIFRDLELVASLKERRPGIMVMLKGAIFFDPEEALLDELDLSCADYLIGLESDFVVGELARAHFEEPEAVPAIRGILYRKDGGWARTFFDSWETDLDSLPFPDRSLMENHLYVRPDTGEPQATIATSRGCPSRCIFCVTPTISGTRLRLRSPANILAELSECYHQHGIRDFFFKSDTFTIDQKWAQEVCRVIMESDLAGKIRWAANSKVKPVTLETLKAMKAAGCWLVAFGYESGHPETIKRIKKGTTVEDNIQATRFAKEAGLLTFGFFLIGLPWETREHLEATRRHVFELDNDFLELHIAVPYPGTELHQEAVNCGLIQESVLGKDYFNSPTVGTVALTMAEIEAFRKKTLLKFHLRPSYIWRKLRQAGSDWRILANYFKFGMRLLKNTLGGAPKKASRAGRVLVLGANSDIGLAIAREFAAREGSNLVLASRDTASLAAKAAEIRRQYGVDVEVVAFDATDTASHKDFYHSLAHRPDGVVLAFGLLDESDPLRVIDVNLMGAASILETVAQDMEERREGFIIGISSVAGERGRKSNYAYGAAKAGLTAYLSGLRHRLFSSGVAVLTVLPGMVRSKMTAHMRLPAFVTSTPERTASDVHAAWRSGRDVVYTSAVWRPIMWIIRNLPEFLFKRTNL